MSGVFRVLALVFAALIGLEIALQTVHFAFFRERSGGIASSGEPQTFRILCIGESTTFGFPHQRDSPKTYPNILLRRLEAEFPGRDFDVSNQGIIGVTTSTVLERLPEWIDAYQPDAIIAMIGINDQFYHNVAYVDELPTRALLALQKLRTYKLAALGWAQLERTLLRPPDTAKPRVGQREHLRMIRTYTRAREHLLAKRYVEAEALFVPLLAEVEALRADDSDRRGVGRTLTQIPVRLIGLYYELNSMLAEIFLRTGRAPLAIELYDRAIELEPTLAGLHFELSRLYGRVGNAAEAETYLRSANALLSEFVLTATADNYAGIRDVASDRGIPLVAVQYPLRDVSHLKILLGDGESLQFVDNQRSFEEAVERHGFGAIFSDAFAGDFGHLTERGNELIVENIFEQAIWAIVREPSR